MSSTSSGIDILLSPFSSAILRRFPNNTYGDNVLVGSICPLRSLRNWRTYSGQRQPLPSLSQQLNIAFAVVQAICPYVDFLLFCIFILQKSNKLKNIYLEIKYSSSFRLPKDSILLFFCFFYCKYQNKAYCLNILIVRYNIMSKSVRSYGSSSARGKSSQQQTILIKQKIKQILYSVKEQRQHIENRLYQNDIEINKLRKQYQMLRYQHDFQHLNTEQQIFVEQLSEGLRQNGIDPRIIMGIPDSSNHKYRSMTKQQVIDVQGMLIKQLANLLKQ